MLQEKAGNEHEPMPLPAATQAKARCDLLARGILSLAQLSNCDNLRVAQLTPGPEEIQFKAER